MASNFTEKAVVRQSLTAVISLMVVLHMGICLGYSAVLIPQLRTKESLLKITNSESSWIASSNTVFMSVGSLFTGILMDNYGRKRALQLTYIFLFFGWIIIFRADSVLALYLGRIITGLATGMDSVAVVYIVETSTLQYRAMFLSWMTPIIMFGVLLSYMLGHFLFWKYSALILSFFSGVCFIQVFIIPESPSWLLSKNRIEEAVKSLKWFRVDPQYIFVEMKELQASMLQFENCLEKTSIIEKIKLTRAWKPFILLTIYFCLTQFSGDNIIISHAVNFYQSFDTPIDPFTSTLIFISLRLFSSLIFLIIIGKFNNKSLIVFSGTGVSISYLLAAVYQYLYGSAENKPMFWFPLVCVWSSVIFTSLGLSNMSWILGGELFPSSVRGFMSSLLWTTFYILMFSAIQIYPSLENYVRTSDILLIFSINALLSTLFVKYTLPETRGKTLTEIEKFWRNDVNL